MHVLLLDNRDSFTHNLAQAFEKAGVRCSVRDNHLDPAEAVDLAPDLLVISPGPGRPSETGRCAEVLGRLGDRVPVLGICLGMQLLAAEAGASIVHSPRPVHGRTSRLRHDGGEPFTGLPEELPVGRYHSLCIDEATLPSCFEARAWAVEDGVLMAFEHRERPCWGLQFHPESVLTPDGPALLRRVLERSAAFVDPLRERVIASPGSPLEVAGSPEAGPTGPAEPSAVELEETTR
ncbi:MAG: aminodeoxychorismate/anthranilate synthase component II [Acidobacteriota bacterium]